MARIDDIRDYVDEEKQEVRENLKMHERMCLAEGDIHFLDSEQADL